MPLVAEGLAVDEIASVEGVVQKAVEKHFPGKTIARALVTQRLERGGARGMRCDRADPTCSAQLGAICEADLVIVASFAAKGDRATLRLRLVDVAEVSEQASAAGSMGADLSVDDVDDVLTALDGPDARVTHLEVRGAGTLLVDGADRGAVPAKLDDLAVGKHDVRVGDFKASVELHKGDLVVVDVPLIAPKPAIVTVAPAPTPTTTAPASSPFPLYAVAGGGVGAVVGVVAVVVGLAPLVGANSGAGALAKLEDQARADPASVDAKQVASQRKSVEDELAAWHSWGLATAVIGGVVVGAGALAAGVGAVLWE